MTTDQANKDEEVASSSSPTGSGIITVLERAWARIRATHPEVPEVTIVTGSGILAAEPGHIVWGHHWANRWHHDASGNVTAELFIAGELLNDGGRAVLETMLHEAAHALARVRGIKDTCDVNNRYHNKGFLALARELGLEKPNVRDKKRGFSDAKIAPATALVYADLIAELDAGLLPYITEPFEVPGTRRPALDLPEETPVSGLEPGGSEVGETEDISHAPAARSGARRRVQCGCPEPRKLSITPAQLDIGPILCGLCLRRFAPQA